MAMNYYNIVNIYDYKVIKREENVFYYYKWSNTEDAIVHGPFTKVQMQEWNSCGYFDSGIYLKSSNESEFKFEYKK